MTDRLLITGACIPMLVGIGLLLLLSRVPARALPSDSSGAQQLGARSDDDAAAEGWIGVVVAANSADLAAPSSGRVEAVYVHTGDRVEQGQRLLQFDPSETSNSVKMAAAQRRERASELGRFRARARAARKRLERLRVGEAWLSKQELEGAIEEARVAEAELQAARASLGVSRIALTQQRMRATRQTLIAPFAGTVVARGADSGDSVAEGQVVLRILGHTRQVRFAVPAGALSSGPSTQVSLQLDGHGDPVVSHVDSLRPEVDPSAQLVFATAPLPQSIVDHERWIPGASVTVRRVAP